MTFVRAVRSSYGLAVYSDWHVTDPQRTSPPGYRDGVLKSLVLSPRVCVSYAGTIPTALAVVRDVRRLLVSGAIDEGLDLLASRSQSGECEFLVAVLDGAGRLFEVKRGVPREGSAAWVGNQLAFEAYQKRMSELREAGADEMSLARSAFDHVVASDSVEGVGVMTVSVITTEDGFEYGVQMGLVAGFTPQHIPSGEWTAVTWGGAHDGAFAYSLMGGAPSHAAVGVYFTHGNFGLVSAPLEHTETAVVQASTQDEFRAAVEERYGIDLKAGIDLS